MFLKQKFCILLFFAFYAENGFSTYYSLDPEKQKVSVTTEEYIQIFDPTIYELSGSNFYDVRYILARVQKPSSPSFEASYAYDFTLLENVSKWLEKVDRLKALKAIFMKLTSKFQMNTHKHKAVIKFLQKATFHNLIQPMYSDRTPVFDPLILLELGEMQCGAVARVCSDIFSAAGWKSRIVQLACHQSCEIYYNDSWHLSECDLAAGGQVITMPNIDRIPSIAELSSTPYSIDKIPSHYEFFIAFKKDNFSGESTYPSYFFFCKEAYKDTKPLYYTKTATQEQCANDKYYGWMQYQTNVASDILLSDIKRHYEAPPVSFESVNTEGMVATITWKKPITPLLHRAEAIVYISKTSRGWNYQNFYGSKQAEKYFQGGWRPECYDKVFQLPSAELGLILTNENYVHFDLPEGEVRYVTVMQSDTHGKECGRVFYNMSPELKIEHLSMTLNSNTASDGGI